MKNNNNSTKPASPSLSSYARILTLKGLLNREIRKKFHKEQDAEQTKILSIADTQSGLHLQSIMGGAFTSNLSEEELVNLFFGNFNELNLKPNEVQKKQFATMLKEEKFHSGQYVFYHGTNNKMAFLYDIFTEFLKQLQHQYADNFKILRVFPNLFIEFENAIQFHDNLKKEVAWQFSGVHIDHSKNYKEMGISTNLFLFGSHDKKDGECTVDFFLQNSSVQPPDIEKLFLYFLKRLQIPANYSDFEKLYQKYLQNSGGACYQIFIESALINQAAYMSAPYGHFSPLTMGNNIINNFSEIIEELKKNPEMHYEYIKDLQARLYLNPKIFHDPNSVEFKVYYANPLSPDESDQYHHKLSHLVSECIANSLAEENKISIDLSSNGEFSLYKQMKMLAENEGFSFMEYVSPELAIPQLLEKNDITDLIKFFSENDVDFSRYLTNKDYFSGVNKLRIGDCFYKNIMLAKKLLLELKDTKEKNPRFKHMIEQLNCIIAYDCVKQGLIEEAVDSILQVSQDCLLRPFVETEASIVGHSVMGDLLSFISFAAKDCNEGSPYYKFGMEILTSLKNKGAEVSHPEIVYHLQIINLLIYITQSNIELVAKNLIAINKLDLNQILIIPAGFSERLDGIYILDALKNMNGLQELLEKLDKYKEIPHIKNILDAFSPDQQNEYALK